MLDLERILTSFQEIVSENICYDLAIKTGLIKRSSSQLKGYELAQALAIPNGFLEKESLNSLACRIQRINPNCNLSASALAQRINTKGAELFMKEIFSLVLKEIIQKSNVTLDDLPKLKSLFNRILVEDSTMMELNEDLSSTFKGRGGAASKSALKINLVFDYLSEKLVSIEFMGGNIPDQKLAGKIIPLLTKNDLVIRDLGYYVLSGIKEIENQQAFYISRHKSNIDIYESIESTEPVDLARYIEKNMHKGIADIQVFIGKEKHSVRLVASLMTEEVINKRKRMVKRNAQRCGTQPTQKKLNLLKFNIFITNIPCKMLTSEEIMALYRVRWQSELIFKQWKSCLKIQIFKGKNLERLYCFLYGRLIMVLLLMSIGQVLMKYVLKMNRELSCYKLANYLIVDHIFALAIQKGELKSFINQLLNDVLRRLCMDKRKRNSLRENTRLGIGFYKNMNYNELNKNVA